MHSFLSSFRKWLLAFNVRDQVCLIKPMWQQQVRNKGGAGRVYPLKVFSPHVEKCVATGGHLVGLALQMKIQAPLIEI